MADKKIDIKQFEKYNYSKDMFEEVKERDFHDKKLETKPVGYFKDAFRRFRKNKGSVVAAIIIMILVAFSLTGSFISKYSTTFADINVAQRLPKSEVFSFLGWDGCQRENGITEAQYLEYRAIEQETGEVVLKTVYKKYTQKVAGRNKKYYDAYVDSYTKNSVIFKLLTEKEYKNLQAYQDEHNVQIIMPFYQTSYEIYKDDANVYYDLNTEGLMKNFPVDYTASTDADTYKFKPAYAAYSTYDGYTSKMRIEGSDNYLYSYANKKEGGYQVRLVYNRYFAAIHNGEEPSFLFGSDQYGKDIFVRLASGARFSFIFAICISVINLTIGAIYGAIEGYYGGVTDMVMERVSDILSGIPFMVVVTLFKLHIMNSVGMIPTLIFAFVLTGWIGMAGSTRMQFYRYKNQEYVLAARTLGARDFRIMFKHIFPNALGTLITSCVLVIPGVIFSESSLSYLGIINLSTGNTTSVGTLLANGQGSMQTFPHIILFPAIFIALLMISFNLFGNGLRDAFNPSLRGSED